MKNNFLLFFIKEQYTYATELKFSLYFLLFKILKKIENISLKKNKTIFETKFQKMV